MKFGNAAGERNSAVNQRARRRHTEVRFDHTDTCRRDRCGSTIDVRHVLTERGTVTLCRLCRNEHFRGVGS